MELRESPERRAAQAGGTSHLRLVPVWVWVLGAVVFLCVQYVFDVVLAQQTDPPSAWIRALMGIVAGAVMVCYLAFIGYINRDAKRRGMNSVLWTVVAIVIPNALGILLYFLLRQRLSGPLVDVRVASTTHGSCPQCGYSFRSSCPQCGNTVDVGDGYCRTCGRALSVQRATDH